MSLFKLMWTSLRTMLSNRTRHGSHPESLLRRRPVVNHQVLEGIVIERVGQAFGEIGEDGVFSAGGDGVVLLARIAVAVASDVDEEAERLPSVIGVASVTRLVAV